MNSTSKVGRKNLTLGVLFCMKFRFEDKRDLSLILDGNSGDYLFHLAPTH